MRARLALAGLLALAALGGVLASGSSGSATHGPATIGGLSQDATPGDNTASTVGPIGTSSSVPNPAVPGDGIPDGSSDLVVSAPLTAGSEDMQSFQAEFQIIDTAGNPVSALSLIAFSVCNAAAGTQFYLEKAAGHQDCVGISTPAPSACGIGCGHISATTSPAALGANGVGWLVSSQVDILTTNKAVCVHFAKGGTTTFSTDAVDEDFDGFLTGDQHPFTSLNSLAVGIGVAPPASCPPTIRVDSNGDSNVRDTLVTLREAILLATSVLAPATLTADEVDNVYGLVGAGTADRIVFDTFVFPPGTPNTIALTSGLPSLSMGNDTIDASAAGVVVDGQTLLITCITIGSGGNAVKGLDIRRCGAFGISITGQANTIGGSNNTPENGTQCTNAVDDDGEGAVNDGCPAVGPPETGTGCSDALDNDFDGSVNDGCPQRGDRNVIHENGTGINISGTAASGNTVIGNRIGTDADGLLDLGNTGNGVLIQAGADTNTVGGTGTGQGNLISGNDGNGVRILGAATFTNTNTVAGNLIGTNAAGTAAIPNSGSGVNINGNADSNVIGGTAAGSRNIISGNGHGVTIDSLLANTNLIQGNFIGTNASGSGALGNVGRGVRLAPSVNNTVGGTALAARNVISGNAVGVEISAGGSNFVQGDYIGTDFSGTADLGNTSDGVQIVSSNSNTIGGTVSGAGNVISGNDFHGIDIFGTANSNLVQGNLIGTNAAGTADLGNAQAGVGIVSDGNTVGGTTSGARNVISGNGTFGVDLQGTGATSNDVRGNFIGIDRAGTAALGNSSDGVRIEQGAPTNTIGGTAVGAGNVISGNGGDGIHIRESGTTGNVVEGNLIGTDWTGSIDRGNAGHGIRVDTASGSVIGGSAAGAGNTIAGNDTNGIYLLNSATGTVIKGNRIGTQVDGVSPLGNVGHGIRMSLGANGNTVGGTAAGESNTIAYNASDGVRVDGATTTGNAVRDSSIYANTGKGIENIAGGNLELAPPVITGIDEPTPGTFMVVGTVCSGCTVEVFSDSEDEGRVFEGFVAAVGINWSFSGALSGPKITARAVDGSNNTSEFSAPFLLAEVVAAEGEPTPVGGAWQPNFDLGINAGGKAVFHDTVTGGGATSGIFMFFAGSVTTLVDTNTATPAGLGGSFQGFRAPINNDSDNVAFWGENNAGTEGLFMFFAGSPGTAPTLLAKEGGSSPTGGGDTYSAFGNVSFNSVNQVAARATVSGSASEGLFMFFAGSPGGSVDTTQVAEQGESAPVAIGGSYTGGAPIFSNPSLNDLGRVAASAKISGGSAAQGLFMFFAGSPLDTRLLAGAGGSTPTVAPDTGGGTFVFFAGQPAINNSGLNGEVAAKATITGGTPGVTEGLFMFFAGAPGDPVTITKLAVNGETAPGTGGGTFTSFGDPVINDFGQVVARATVSGGILGVTEGLFMFFAGSAARAIALEGDPATGGGNYASFAGVAYNDNSQVVFVANLINTVNAQGVFVVSVDVDLDGLLDVQDNCPAVFNPPQTNTDGDSQGNSCDLDDDNDSLGFTTVKTGGTCSTGGLSQPVLRDCIEQQGLLTDTLDACNATTTANDEAIDAWGPDFNDSRRVDGLDVFLFAQRFGSTTTSTPAGKLPYLARFDLNADGALDGLDVFLLQLYFNKSC